jgi:hypothetical protein
LPHGKTLPDGLIVASPKSYRPLPVFLFPVVYLIAVGPVVTVDKPSMLFVRLTLGYHLKSGQWLSLQNRPTITMFRTWFSTPSVSAKATSVSILG